MMDYDVIVVGAGNAALCAALAAAETVKKILVLERAPEEDSGGNSRYTAGLMRVAYAGVEPTASASSAAKRSATAGLFAALAASMARRSMIAFGVFAGAFKPYHCEVSKPG